MRQTFCSYRIHEYVVEYYNYPEGEWYNGEKEI